MTNFIVSTLTSLCKAGGVIVKETQTKLIKCETVDGYSESIWKMNIHYVAGQFHIHA